MATINAVNNALGGVTGTGSFVGSTSPTITSPRIVTAINDSNGVGLLSLTATSSAVNYISLINNSTGNPPALTAVGSDTNINLQLGGKGTGSVQITGTTTNNNAVAGSVGEVISSNIPAASAVSLSDVTATNLTSISLTAGDWDVYGNVYFTISNVCLRVHCWTSTTSATEPDFSLESRLSDGGNAQGLGGNQGMCTPFLRVSIASTTTVYLSALTHFTSGSVTVCGSILARRAR